MKKLSALVLILVLSISLTACLPDEKAYEADDKNITVEDLTITLTDSFMKMSFLASDFTACYGATDVTVLFLEETFDALEVDDSVTLEAYTEAVRSSYSATEMSEVISEDDLVYFEYTGESDDGTVYKYFAVTFKSNDSFWLLQFATDEEMYEEYKPYFIQWSKTVGFAD